MLRRPTDRVEDAAAWALVAAGLLLVILGVLAGPAVHAAALELGAEAGQERTRVQAVLVDDASPPPATATGPQPAYRTARYLDDDEQQRQIAVPVHGRPAAGIVVTVWVGPDGNPTAPPLTQTEAVVLGAAAAVVVPALGGVVLVVAWVLVRRRLDRVNAARWAREWARIEPEWSGRDR